MNNREIINFFKGRKKQNDIGIQLRKLMKDENCERMIAVFFDRYVESYTILPSDKLLNLTFGINDDLDMVGEMLIQCAKIKHQQKENESLSYSKKENPTANVLLYNYETKDLLGGLTVFVNDKNVACVINERERLEKIEKMKQSDDVM